MPQFDPAIFSSQIFWLLICFLVFYFAMSKIYLPKIAFALKKRGRIIDVNKFRAQNLEKEIEELNHNSAELRKNSALQYKTAMSLATKQLELFRQEAENNFKKRVSKIIEESKINIENFYEQSKKDSNMAVTKLVENISQKIFNQSLSKEEIESLKREVKN